MDQQTAIFLFWATVVVSVISNSYALFRLYHDGKYSYLIFVAISYLTIFAFIALLVFITMYVYNVNNNVSLFTYARIIFVIGVLEIIYGDILLWFISEYTIKKNPRAFMVDEDGKLRVSFETNMVSGAMRTYLMTGYCWFFIGGLEVQSFLKIFAFVALFVEGWFILFKMVSIVEKHTQKRLEKLGILVDGQLVEDKGVNHE